jgi:hypothetical protein
VTAASIELMLSGTMAVLENRQAKEMIWRDDYAFNQKTLSYVCEMLSNSLFAKLFIKVKRFGKNWLKIIEAYLPE